MPIPLGLAKKAGILRSGRRPQDEDRIKTRTYLISSLSSLVKAADDFIDDLPARQEKSSKGRSFKKAGHHRAKK